MRVLRGFRDRQHRRRGDNGSHTESGKKGVHRVSE
jgi:hypothetical protein